MMTGSQIDNELSSDSTRNSTLLIPAKLVYSVAGNIAHHRRVRLIPEVTCSAFLDPSGMLDFCGKSDIEEEIRKDGEEALHGMSRLRMRCISRRQGHR